MIRALYDRKDAIITEDTDKKKKEETINKALNTCGYPTWALKKFKKDKETKQKEDKPKKSSKDDANKSKGMVVVPCGGVSERVSRVLRRCAPL